MDHYGHLAHITWLDFYFNSIPHDFPLHRTYTYTPYFILHCDIPELHGLDRI